MTVSTKSRPKDSAIRIAKGHARLMGAPPQHVHEACVGNTTPNPKWLALLKAAALRRQDEGFAGNMVRMAFALLQDVMQLFTLVGSVSSMAQKGSALSPTAPLL